MHFWNVHWSPLKGIGSVLMEIEDYFGDASLDTPWNIPWSPLKGIGNMLMEIEDYFGDPSLDTPLNFFRGTLFSLHCNFLISSYNKVKS